MDLATSFAPSQHKPVSVWAQFHALAFSNLGVGYHTLKDNAKQLCPLRVVRNRATFTQNITATYIGVYSFSNFTCPGLLHTLSLDPPSSRRNTQNLKAHQGSPLRTLQRACVD